MEVARWLDDRSPPMPVELRRVVDAALERSAAHGPVSGSSATSGVDRIADHLADAGLATLERVVAADQDRSAADELLAADALLTYACEAAAEAGTDALDRVLNRFDFPAFAQLLEPSGP